MARFRQQKTLLAKLCSQEDWASALEEKIADPIIAAISVSPLLALLPRPELRWQAVFGFGLAVPQLARQGMETARVIMRRLMWSLNEESGNLGWGVPEAMAAALAACPALAGEYARIFLSYGYETGKDDNFLDHAPLRRGVYWGIGHLARHATGFARPALPHLAKALRNADGGVRGMAARAIKELALRTPDKESGHAEVEVWETTIAALEQAHDEMRENSAYAVDYLEDRRIVLATTQFLLGEALFAVRERLE